MVLKALLMSIATVAVRRWFLFVEARRHSSDSQEEGSGGSDRNGTRVEKGERGREKREREEGGSDAQGL